MDYVTKGFVELTSDEMELIDGGKSGWDILGDIGGAVCAGGSAYLVATAAAAATPVGWVAIAGAAAAALWTAYRY